MQRYLSGLLLAILILLSLSSEPSVMAEGRLDKILNQPYYFHREVSGIASYRIANATFPSRTEALNYTDFAPIGTWEVANGWIFPSVPRDINLTKDFTFLFSVWTNGTGLATLFFRFYVWRNEHEISLFTSKASGYITDKLREQIWLSSVGNQTIQVKEGDRLVLRLFIKVERSGYFFTSFDGVLSPSYANDPTTIIKYPGEDGAYVSLAVYPSSPTTHYTKVNENPPDNDTTYLKDKGSSQPMAYDVFIKEAISFPEGYNITSVRVVLTVKTHLYVPECSGIASARLRNSTANITSSGVDIAWSTYSEVTFSWSNLSPFTGLAWTQDEINAMQFGLGLEGGFDFETSRYRGCRCTQVRLEIDYTVPGGAIWNYVSGWPFNLTARAWTQISFWPFTLITESWKMISSWTFDFISGMWNPISSWIFSLRSPGWFSVSSWTFELATLGWHSIAFWIFSLTPFSTGFLLIPLIFLVGVVLFLMAVALGKKFHNEF